MNTELVLRPAQRDILYYEGGRMAVSAVPGSGKTFTLSLLAANLIAGGRIDPESGQEVLIVTFLNSSVDTFKARVRRRLAERDLPDSGFDVRTLHSLALEILRWSGEASADTLTVIDEAQSSQLRAAAVDGWINDNQALWEAFLPERGQGLRPQMVARWRDVTSRTAAAFIRTAKNERYRPEDIRGALQRRAQAGDGPYSDPAGAMPLLVMLAGIYSRYQAALARLGAVDYDELIWQAVDLLEQRPDLVESLRQRWPYILEDEAQDSVPLQQTLLEILTGQEGNWVRVGDPNQAITSAFTAADPRFFSQFIDRPDVVAKELPNSGRSAPKIIGAANRLLEWTIDSHPVPEVRQMTFRRQAILPTPPGDSQPNPPDDEATLRIRVYKSRDEDELPAVAQLAWQYAQRLPLHTVAILVPTHSMGFSVAEQLDRLNADYDNLLRGSGREREVAAALHSVLAVLANPLDAKALQSAYASLYAAESGDENGEAGASEATNRLNALIRSIHSPEAFLFPRHEDELLASLPAGIVEEAELGNLGELSAFLRHAFELRALPVDDLTVALADELFARPGQDGGSRESDDTPDSAVSELDLAITYQIASQMRQWREAQPEWRLPELVAQLQLVASGQRSLSIGRPNDHGFEPAPGRITLTTQHGAKGLEWDAVFLVGIDGNWIPGTLDAHFLGVHDFLGGDPSAEAVAQLRHLMQGEAGLYEGHTATDSVHLDVIAERLRLLYVGITRARRFLQISRSRATRAATPAAETEPATILGVIYQYLKELEGD